MGRWVTHRMVLSLSPREPEPETMVLPSLLMATQLTAAVCPLSLLVSLPVAMSHTLRHVGNES